ncbi:hypothetical protein [Actinosynnema sp. NPDC023587]|uniref:hypothetical protein n=1 Tax=Actinosynnema sp. NPDC023587 TaxID=3154695 RepID=UPI0033CAD1A4
MLPAPVLASTLPADTPRWTDRHGSVWAEAGDDHLVVIEHDDRPVPISGPRPRAEVERLWGRLTVAITPAQLDAATAVITSPLSTFRSPPAQITSLLLAAWPHLDESTLPEVAQAAAWHAAAEVGLEPAGLPAVLLAAAPHIPAALAEPADPDGEYVRSRYGVPARVGGHVVVDGRRQGRIVAFSPGIGYPMVQYTDGRHPVACHPVQDVAYVPDEVAARLIDPDGPGDRQTALRHNRDLIGLWHRRETDAPFECEVGRYAAADAFARFAFIAPNSCRWCDEPRETHLSQHCELVGWHTWAEPTDAMRLSRMRGRRARRQEAAARQARTAAGHSPIAADDLRRALAEQITRAATNHGLPNLGPLLIDEITGGLEPDLARVAGLHAEITALREKLDQAHQVLGENLLVDMEPPVPPYGSPERAARVALRGDRS